MKDPWFKSTGLTLKDWGFNLLEQRGPDAEHFGNWVLVGHRDNVALRIFRDRDRIGLDLMPAHLFFAGAPEPDWYTRDVVASALELPFKPEIEPLEWFRVHMQDVNRAFEPENWKWTKERLARVEEEKRRRFTEDRRVRERVHA